MRFDLAACSQLTFTPRLSERQANAFRIAMIGPLLGDDATMTTMVQGLPTDELDYVHFFGSVASGSDGSTFGSFLTTMCPDYPNCQTNAGLGVPFGVSFGPDDLLIRDGFHETFGQTDVITHIGDVPFLMLNTSLGGLSEDQFAFIADIPTGGPPGIAVMDTPPFGISPLRHDGLRNGHEATRLQSLLEARGFKWIFMSSADGFVRYSVGETEIFGIPSELGYADVTLLRADAERDACDADTTCDTGESCLDGYCHVPCTREQRVPGPLDM